MDMLKPTRDSQKGFAFIVVLLVLAMMFVVVAVLLFQTSTARLVAANEHDHLAALAHAESGITWAHRRMIETNDVTDQLLGPDNSSTTDDNLIGLRDLSLTATSQFNSSNEATASAIVSRDFDGQGSKSWEVVRINDGTEARALLYARLDDNHDDDPDDPGNDDPLLDTDYALNVTVVAEYPVFVDANGVEQITPVDRGRARRTLRVTYGVVPPEAAMASNGDILLDGGEICGDCGAIHSNDDMNFNSATSVCQDATSAGSVTGSTGSVVGDVIGGDDPVWLPAVNPYDDLFVPSIDVFDTSADTGLPPGLRCPLASATDPGANKYFALVSTVPGGSKGEVWKAYWDFGNDRWTWRMIDDLSDSTEVALDDCGRAPGDANFGLGDADAVDDGALQYFYGFRGAKTNLSSCALCTDSGADSSYCRLADNDFNANGYYPASGGGLVAWPRLPGNFQPDGVLDVVPSARPNDDWSNSSSTVSSPVFGAVLWVLSSISFSGSVGVPGSINFECGATAGCNPNVMPYGTFPVSIIALGSISLSGSSNVSPANPDAGYYFLFVSGRDLVVSGNTQEDTQACAGTCSVTVPVDIERIAGIYAAHEQIAIGGNPNIFGFLVAEEAIDCDNSVNAPTKINGNPEIQYDCDHPPNPWLADQPPKVVAWQEVE
jgi:Tfp pilus assembly protein PilX